MAKHSRVAEASNLGEMSAVITSYLATYVKQIEEAFGTIEEPIRRAYVAASKPMAEDIEKFMRQHHKTGLTIGSFDSGTLVVDGNLYRFKFGFDIKKGGLPALFLEYGDRGSPTRRPNKSYFFMNRAVKTHSGEIETHMEKEFKRMLDEVGE